MIPSFHSNGLLPPGVHWALWDEIEDRFGTNPHRRILLKGMNLGLSSLTVCGCSEVFLDGSFVTAKKFPSDYDVCWDVLGVDLVRLRSVQPALLSFSNERALQKAKFLGEFFPANARAETRSPFRTFLNFFQTDRDTGDQKGIVGLRTKTPQ